MTTEAQKTKVKALCNKIAEIEDVHRCYIDDYGKFGNFSVIIVRKDKDHFKRKASFRKIIPTARKEVRNLGLIWRSNAVDGRWEDYNLVDIDCQPFDPEANTFQEQV